MSSSRNRQLVKTALLLAALPLTVLGVKKIIDIRKGAAGTPANISIEVDTYTGSLPTQLWQNLAQGGEEPADMIGPVWPLVRALKPQLIRVDHLFDYYNVYQGPDNFDFSRLDKVVQSIVLTGATPLLSLSYTPASMAKNNQNAGEPQDWNQWYQLVKATADRYSRQKEISGIYYEVWNEPDLFGGWHYSKSPSYSLLYTHTARAIRDGAEGSSFKIGGPAITAFYPNWIRALMSTASSQRLPLDFISWHRYSKNLTDYEQDIDKLESILADYPQYINIERLITEFGPNSEPDPDYDNLESGVHLISLVTRLIGRVHRLFPFEIVDGPTSRSNVSTGWGMITHPPSPRAKPRYNAVQFLNRLQGQRLALTGQGSWVTALATRQGSKIQVLLSNYDPRSQHVETFPLALAGVQPGTWKIESYTYPRSGIEPRVSQVEVTSFRLQKEYYLEPNTSLLLEFTPQP
jgi:hypothetical protein